MPAWKGSKLYLFIPDSFWSLQVPAFISNSTYPAQSIGWFNESQVWVRPTWSQAYSANQIGPESQLLDTGRVPNVLWHMTSFYIGQHPPMLGYANGDPGILEKVAQEGQLRWDLTLTQMLDEVTVHIQYLTNQEAKILKYDTARLELQTE